MLVDFHCHLDLFPDPAAAIAEADRAGVYTLSVTTTPRAWEHNVALTAKSRRVRVALGLHPQLVSTHAKEIAIWEQHLPNARYIGEVGLDAGPNYYKSLDTQKQIFERILTKCADVGGKILSVHSVRSATPVLDLIEDCLPQSRGKVVMHWFTGSLSEARRAVQLGCYFSVNEAMFKSSRGRALVATLPISRILTETDAPFTTIGNRPSKPGDVAVVVDRLAAIHSMSSLEATNTVVTNLRELVGTIEN